MVVMVAVTMPVVTAIRAGVATYKAVDVYRFRQDAKSGGDMILQPAEEEPAGGLAILVPGRKPAGIFTFTSRGNCVASGLDAEQPLPQLCSKQGVTFEEWKALIDSIETRLMEAHSTLGYVPVVKYIHQRWTRNKLNQVIEETKEFVKTNEMLDKHGLHGELLVADDQALMDMRVKQEGEERSRKPPRMAVALLILPKGAEMSAERKEDIKLVALDRESLNLDTEEETAAKPSAPAEAKAFVVSNSQVTHNLPFTAE